MLNKKRHKFIFILRQSMRLEIYIKIQLLLKHSFQGKKHRFKLRNQVIFRLSSTIQIFRQLRTCRRRNPRCVTYAVKGLPQYCLT